MSYIDELAILKQKLNNNEITLEQFKAEKHRILETTQTEAKEQGALSLYLSSLKKIFSCKGRANRREFWLFHVTNDFIMSLFTLIPFFINEQKAYMALSQQGNNLLSFLLGLVTFIISISIWVRRFHDFGKSGLFAFKPILIMAYFLPFLLIAIFIPSIFIIGVLIPLFVGGIFGFIWGLFAAFRKGNPYDNVYGPTPKTKKSVIAVILLIIAVNITLTTVVVTKVAKHAAKDTMQQVMLQNSLKQAQVLDINPMALDTFKQELTHAIKEQQQQKNSLTKPIHLGRPSITEPFIETPAEPVTEPVAEPIAEPTVETPAEPIAEPVAEPTVETPAEPVTEPVAEPTVGTPAEPVAEPSVETPAEPIVEPTPQSESQTDLVVPTDLEIPDTTKIQ